MALRQVRTESAERANWGPDRAATIRTRLVQHRNIGRRLEARSAGHHWRRAVRLERRLLTAAVILATDLPVIAVGLVAFSIVRDHRVSNAALFLLSISLLALTMTAAAVTVRRYRVRLEYRVLGRELQRDSETLLDQLFTVREARRLAPEEIAGAVHGVNQAS